MNCYYARTSKCAKIGLFKTIFYDLNPLIFPLKKISLNKKTFNFDVFDNYCVNSVLCIVYSWNTIIYFVYVQFQPKIQLIVTPQGRNSITPLTLNCILRWPQTETLNISKNTQGSWVYWKQNKVGSSRCVICSKRAKKSTYLLRIANKKCQNCTFKVNFLC